MWGGSNYGEGSVRSGRSRYSLSLMRALGADPTNYGEGSDRSGRSRYSLSLMRDRGAVPTIARVQSAQAAPGTVYHLWEHLGRIQLWRGVQCALAAPGSVYHWWEHVGRIQLWRGFSAFWPLQVQFITDESMWGGSNYGEVSVRSGRSRYSI